MARSLSTKSSWTSLRFSRDGPPAVGDRTLNWAVGLSPGSAVAARVATAPAVGFFGWVPRRRGVAGMPSPALSPQAAAFESVMRGDRVADLACGRLQCSPFRPPGGTPVHPRPAFESAPSPAAGRRAYAAGERLASRFTYGSAPTDSPAKHRFLWTKALNRRKCCDTPNVGAAGEERVRRWPPRCWRRVKGGDRS
jgi:hypothetical protein